MASSKKIKPLSLDGVVSYPLKSRKNKVKIEDFGKPWQPGGRFGKWIDCLPRQLAGNDFRAVVRHIVEAVQTDHLVILAMGAHAIKVGLNPIILHRLKSTAMVPLMY